MTDDLKARLLAGEGDSTEKVETHAGVITVRALTRSEVLNLRKGKELGKIDIAEYERRMVAIGMVDPEMTPEDVKVWQDHDKAGGALADVTDKIAELSGLTEGASKSGVSRAGRRSRT